MAAPGPHRLSFDELAPELQELLEPRVARLGYLGDFFAVAGHQPAALAHFYRFTESLKAAMPWRLAEIVALSVAALTGNDYERAQHERLAASLGMDEETLSALSHARPEAAELNDAERAAAALAREMVRSLGHDAGDALAELARCSSEPIAVACALLGGRYIAHATISNAFGLLPPVESPLGRDRSRPRPDDLLGELAIACRQLAREGHEDGNWGHLAARDPAGRGFWLKRNGIGLGEVRGPEDFILLDFDGVQLGGAGKRHKEWPIHAEIMRARGDVVATAHTHALSFALFSVTDVQLQQLVHESAAFVQGIPRFRDTSDLIATPELGRSLARELGDARAVLMANHGATVTGTSVADLAVNVRCLSRAIEAQRSIASTGWPVMEPDQDESIRKGERIWSPEMADVHWSFWRRRDARSSTYRHRQASDPGDAERDLLA